MAECANCQSLDRDRVNLKEERDDLKKENKTLTEKAGQVATLQGQLTTVTGERDTLQTAHPDLPSIINHCEDGSCKVHKDQWDGLKANIVKAAIEGAPKEIIAGRAAELGLMPQKIRVKIPGV